MSGFSLMDKYIAPQTYYPASLLGYYKGPGFADLTDNHNDGIQHGTVPQPSLPTPPAGGANWFMNGAMTDDVDYVELPGNMLAGKTQGVIEFYYLDGDGGAQGLLWTYTIPNVTELYCVIAGGNLIFQQVIGGVGGSTIVVTAPVDNDLIRLEFSSTNGMKVYYNAVLQGSDATAYQAISWTDFYVGPHFGNGAFSGDFGIDGFAVFDDVTATYPPVKS